MSASHNLLPRSGGAIVFVVLMSAWLFYNSHNRPRPDDIVEQSHFGAQYGRTWELVEHFSRCTADGDRSESSKDAVAVQSAYAEMRRKIATSPFENQARIIDRQFQLLMKPFPDQTIMPLDICKRTAFLAPVTKAQVLSAIAATQRIAGS